MNAVLLPLETIATRIDWPEPETDLEDGLFAAATVVFVEPLRCDRERAALRNTLGGQRFEHLMGLLTFIRTAHYWTMIHPDLGFDDDVRQMLNQHEELARLLLEDPEAARSDMGVRLFNELELLRDLNERRELEKAKHALEVELAHVSRVAMMRELTASIAHEVLQPPQSTRMPTRASAGSQKGRLTSTERGRVSSRSPVTANKRAKWSRASARW